MKKLISSTLFLLLCSITIFAQNYEVFDITSNLGIYSVVPSNKEFGRTEINYDFNTFTDDPDGMRIFITPYSQGSECSDCETVVGSPLVSEGNSITTLKFWIEGGQGLVDELRVKITGITVNDVKREFSIPVRIFYGQDYPEFYNFGTYTEGQIQYQCLIGEDKAYMVYNYKEGVDNRGYKMTAYPMTKGNYSPFYLTNKGSRNPETDEDELCSFFIGGGKFVSVDSIELVIKDYEEDITYGSFIIPANISFGKVIVDGLFFQDVENFLGFGDYFDIEFSTKVKQNYSSNYWVYFDPIMGDSVINNCTGNEPGVYSSMDPEGFAEYTVQDNNTYADGFRLQIWDNDGVDVLGQLDFQGIFNDFRVVHAPVDLEILSTSPVDYSLSRLGDAIYSNISLYSEDAMEVYARMTLYADGLPIEGVETAVSNDIELGDGLEYVSLSTIVDVPTHVTSLLIEVVDENSNDVILSYMRKVNKRVGVLSTQTKEAKLDQQFDFTAYPNPSTGNVYLDLQSITGAAKINVYNSLGQSVYEVKENLNGQTIPLNIEQRGIYKISVKTADKIGVQTIVIQ
jgi:hypothetical protein